MSRPQSLESFLVTNPPKDLVFKNVGTTGGTVDIILTLTNPEDVFVYFKVKVTTPKRYCVKPNQGGIAPKQTKELTITLTPTKAEELKDCKDKFLIQSIKGEVDQTPDVLFKNTPKGQIGESKLFCKFLEEAVVDNPANDSISKPQGDVQAQSRAKVSAESDAEKEKIAQENIKLKNDYASVKKELEEFKRNANNTSGSTGARTQTKQLEQQQPFPLPMIIIAVIIGCLIGRFLI